VASAAAVAAMSAPTGYGRLVVLSSNFAGTEFELSRPQMIVGRTDENDLVINHRSMSRNHAKIVREPETGRYTISDLQSSNGVRVNGQDYGKVELRRGDVVDLGHVRLRFVEPGEDFVFARDGVITDVPETGGKRGLMIGLAAAVIVLGGGALFMMNRGGGKDDGKGGTKGSGSAVVTNGGGSGSGGSAMAGNGPGSDVVTNQNNPATNPGSDVTSPPGIDAMVAETMIDAAGAVASTNPDDEKARKQTECRGYTTAKKWQDLFNCSQELAKLGGADATVSEFKDRAQREQANDARLGKLETALANKDFGEAHKLLDKIDDDSVYKVDAKNKLAAKERGLVDDFRARGKRLATAGKCKDLEILSKQAAAQSADAGDAVRGIRCTEQPAGDNPNNGNKPPDGKLDNPPAGCDAAGLEAQAMGLLNTGMFAQALTIFEQASKCKPSYKLVKFSYMASCRSQNAGKAKAYFAKLTAPDQSKMIQMCLSEHITP
jgi:pSer/pThr/pTyr-binding forkhead associated (FHA) protein/tetratricopeptide (TPR) repeat protein